MFEREPIFHDRQSVLVDGPLTTTSSTFVSIPGAFIITKDLGSDGNYLVLITIGLQHSNNNSIIDVRACVNGIPTMTQTIAFGPNSAGDPKTETINGNGIMVPSASTVDIEWSTPSGTATLNSLTMIIDGIPVIRVIE